MDLIYLIVQLYVINVKKKKKKQQTLLVLNDDDEVIVIQETYINCECKDQEIAGKNIYFNYIKTYILGKRK